MTVAEFRHTVEEQLETLVADLRSLTGRGGEEEAQSWRRSLPRLADVLCRPELAALHLNFTRREHHVAIEYQLPGASAWCDVVLIGRHAGRPAAVIVELKDWDTRTDKPGAWEGLVERWGSQDLHPSEQVRGYVHYCRRFHSAVLDELASVHGFVLFTSAFVTQAYAAAPNDALYKQFPVFTTAAQDVKASLPEFLASRLTESDAAFAHAFASGGYRQDRSFMSQIGAELLGQDADGAFELLDNQRRALALCQARINHLLVERTTARRKVVIVEGPPGSGKSAVAARLWATLVTNAEIREGNIAIVTTSASQSSNWVHLIDQVAGERAGWGVARKATGFSPLTTVGLNQLRTATGKRDLYRDASKWREHLADLRTQASARFQPGSADDACLACLVDEAHALINPEREHGVGQYGFVTGLGPQAFHVMRASRLTVFFIDPAQSFRLRENTSIADIEHWAAELGADVERVSLAGAQFRSAGSAEYVAWVESLLAGARADVNRVHASSWAQADAAGHARVDQVEAPSRPSNVIQFPARPAHAAPPAVANGGPIVANEPSAKYQATKDVLATSRGFDLRIFDNPFEMEAALRRHSPAHSVRLLSSYSRPWKTDGVANPHGAFAEAQDFCERVEFNGQQRRWAKPWNVVPNGDYTAFVQGRPGFRMHDDPLCEVGCTYAVRGFDFHYVGLVWLDDLVWRNGAWCVQVANVHESGVRLLRNRAAREGALAPVGPNGEMLMEKMRQAYRILLTRSIKGLYVWVADPETRQHIQRSLGS